MVHFETFSIEPYIARVSEPPIAKVSEQTSDPSPNNTSDEQCYCYHPEVLNSYQSYDNL